MLLAEVGDVQIAAEDFEAMPRRCGKHRPSVVAEMLGGHVMKQHRAIAGAEGAVLHQVSFGALEAAKEAEDVEDFLAPVVRIG